MKEQAALSASELTADSVSEFAAASEEDCEVEEVSDYSKGSKHTWEKILRNVVKMSSKKVSEDDDVFQIQNGSIKVPKVNGNHSKHMHNVSLKAKGESLSQGNGVAEMILANIPIYKEVLPGLESWRDCKVASWDKLEGHSIQWFCVICIDRRGTLMYIKGFFNILPLVICYLRYYYQNKQKIVVIYVCVPTIFDVLMDQVSIIMLYELKLLCDTYGGSTSSVYW